MSEGTLIGILSADLRYGPGSMSDEILTFMADHRGFWKFSGPGSSYIEAFRWEISGEGTLTISGTAGYDIDYAPEGERVAQEPGLLHIDELRFHIECEDTLNGNRMEVLTLDEGGDRWKRALSETSGHLSDKFVLRRRDLADYRPPECLRW